MMAQQSPMYQQIAAELRGEIEQAANEPDNDDLELKPGDQLPTEMQLRERYGASRNTIRDAIKLLIDQRLVETRPGQGTYVLRKIDPFVTLLSPDPETGVGGGGEEGATYLSMVNEQHRKANVTTPKVEVLSCPTEVALRLRIKPRDQVISRQQQRYIDNTLWSIQTSFYPMEWVTRGATRLLMAENIDEGSVKYLADALGLTQVGYRDWVTARVPVDNEPALFGLPHNAAMFRIFRTAFTADEIATRVTVTVYPADRSQLVYNFGDVPDLSYEQDPR